MSGWLYLKLLLLPCVYLLHCSILSVSNAILIFLSLKFLPLLCKSITIITSYFFADYNVPQEYLIHGYVREKVCTLHKCYLVHVYRQCMCTINTMYNYPPMGRPHKCKLKEGVGG